MVQCFKRFQSVRVHREFIHITYSSCCVLKLTQGWANQTMSVISSCSISFLYFWSWRGGGVQRCYMLLFDFLARRGTLLSITSRPHLVMRIEIQDGGDALAAADWLSPLQCRCLETQTREWSEGCEDEWCRQTTTSEKTPETRYCETIRNCWVSAHGGSSGLSDWDMKSLYKGKPYREK